MDSERPESTLRMCSLILTFTCATFGENRFNFTRVHIVASISQYFAYNKNCQKSCHV